MHLSGRLDPDNKALLEVGSSLYFLHIVVIKWHSIAFCLSWSSLLILTWQTSLKALSGAVSYIDIAHHESLLASVSCFYMDLCVYLCLLCITRMLLSFSWSIFFSDFWNEHVELWSWCDGCTKRPHYILGMLVENRQHFNS